MDITTKVSNRVEQACKKAGFLVKTIVASAMEVNGQAVACLQLAVRQTEGLPMDGTDLARLGERLQAEDLVPFLSQELPAKSAQAGMLGGCRLDCYPTTYLAYIRAYALEIYKQVIQASAYLKGSPDYLLLERNLHVASTRIQEAMQGELVIQNRRPYVTGQTLIREVMASIQTDVDSFCESNEITFRDSQPYLGLPAELQDLHARLGTLNHEAQYACNRFL